MPGLIDKSIQPPEIMGISTADWTPSTHKPLRGIAEAMTRVRRNEKLFLAQKALEAQVLAERVDPRSATAAEASVIFDKP